MKKLTTLAVVTSLFILTTPTTASADGWPGWIGIADWIFGTNEIDMMNDVDLSKDLDVLEDDFDFDVDITNTVIHPPSTQANETYGPAFGVQDFWDLYFKTMYGTDSSGKPSVVMPTKSTSSVSAPKYNDENWPDWIDEPNM